VNAACCNNHTEYIRKYSARPLILNISVHIVKCSKRAKTGYAKICLIRFLFRM